MWAIIIILIFFVIVFYITYRAQKAGVKTGVEYLLAGRGLGWIATFAGLYMTMMSAYTFMGMPGLAYRVGVGAWMLGLVTASQAGIILFYYPKLRALGSRFHFMTQADYLCDRFHQCKIVPAVHCVDRHRRHDRRPLRHPACCKRSGLSADNGWARSHTCSASFSLSP